MESSSSVPEQPDLSPTNFRKPQEINAKITKNKCFYNEKNEKDFEITETEIKIMQFLEEIGIKSCSPFEKIFEYYEKNQKTMENSENSENSADFPKKNTEKIKLNSSLYLKRSKTFRNVKMD